MTSNDDTATGFIEIDDCEEGYETNASGESETTTLSSSIQEWLVENGRRYHAYYGPDKNMMPTDEIEQERLDLHHEMLLLITDGDLYKAPVDRPQRVLDLGTGTGIWATDYAHEHPEAEVIGLDLSPIQPNWVPPNCRFEVDDFEREWTSQEESFDFIHARNICHSVTDWPVVLTQVMTHLKPGAWFELAEVGSNCLSDDNSVPEDWPPKRCFDLGTEAVAKLGRIPMDGKEMKKMLIKAGYGDVQVKTFKHPLTPWPKNKKLKHAGGLFALQAETVYHAHIMGLLTRVMGWSAEKADELCKAAHAATIRKRTGIHAYIHFYVGYGRKPAE